MLGGATRRAGYAMVGRALRRTFRRITWVEPPPLPPAERPVVLYANHHAFHDSYVLGWLVERALARRTVVWMAALDRFPFFAPLGALPFPPDSARRRAATVRTTRALMARDPRTTLVYYPEAALGPAEAGLAPFPAERIPRLARTLPAAVWWPVALRVTGFESERPTVLLAAGAPHAADGGERERLEALLARLAAPAARSGPVVLEGRAGADERWDFARLGPLFGVRP
jgi:hypothetical protein